MHSLAFTNKTQNKFNFFPKADPSLRTTPHSSENKCVSLKKYFHSPSPNKTSNYLDSHRNEKSILIDDESNKLKSQFICQTNTIKEYDNWVNLLMNIINSKTDTSNHYDYASLIQKGLEKIENLEFENLEFLKKYIREVQKNKEKLNLINDMKSQLEVVNSEDEDREKITKEKLQLLGSINCISEELDDLSEKNKSYESMIGRNWELSKASLLFNELKSLKEENRELKEIDATKNIKNKNPNFSYTSKSTIISNVADGSSNFDNSFKHSSTVSNKDKYSD